MWTPPKPLKQLLGCGAACLLLLGAATLIAMEPVARDFKHIRADMQAINIKDRHGLPLTITYQGRWNTSDITPLHAVPDYLKTTFLVSEDRHFYEHGGVDWVARVNALWQDFRTGHVVRGASTISEQVVRMIHPRPRNIWSKWVEGIEAISLETRFSKPDIYEFYLNQIPYAANRRGVAQAARYYFNRDLSTLTPHEMMTLVVIARAPSAYDLYSNPSRIDSAVARLAKSMNETPVGNIGLQKPTQDIYAQHFARYMRLNHPDVTLTSLDASLQTKVQNILDTRVKTLASRHVQNGGALVMDHKTGEILAWVVAGAAGGDEKTPAGDIDTVTTPRQPGSAMKPFLYAAAIDKGWNGATLLNDSPLAASVGTGLHRFRNYSNSYYGPITLREALGNSLNIPALLTIQYVGVADYLSLLQKLGFQSLGKSSDVYDEGLALGNGEVTLLEMATAYGALANHGMTRSPRLALSDNKAEKSQRLFGDETTSIVANILSDPWARRLEFGSDSVMNLPIQTAAKTGTSTDYRDAWVFGFNDRYVVGIWMGNLDRTPMNNVTGSVGPALAMRSIFAELNRDRDTKRLYLSPHLVWQDVCVRPVVAGKKCPTRSELFPAGHIPPSLADNFSSDNDTLQLVRPTEGLQIAYDPRIPASHQKFRFELHGLKEGRSVVWELDGEVIDGATGPQYLWPVSRGEHRLEVHIKGQESAEISLHPINFTVK